MNEEGKRRKAQLLRVLVEEVKRGVRNGYMAKTLLDYILLLSII